MPPKVKITKDEILKAALGIVRKGGVQALNARALADALGCSTQPVFSNYPGMDELRADVDRTASELYREYLASGAKRSDVPKYKAFGLAYIEFAKEEPELFRLLFMCDRSNEKGRGHRDSRQNGGHYIVRCRNFARRSICLSP